MEIIKNKNNKSYRHKTNGYIVAIIFILIGLLFLGRNLGIVNSYVFNIFISWQMLLIVLGLWSIFRRQYSGGTILLIIGAFFIIPELTASNKDLVHTYWPLIFVLLGVLILFKRNRSRRYSRINRMCSKNDVPYISEDGFFRSENTFGAIRHIVLDPVFKGAMIKNTFASTIIDLRRTTLDMPETFINIDCTFGGIEIYVSSNWYVISDINPVFGGCDDKRYQPNENIDYEHKLIIKGSLNFSGIEIKS
ncbi:MAG: cell wall-active antibiotics response protein [Prevotellaceae bacterium]|jgi:predicted membrane protein|nr:cell wall-active antibiotics response protein [Prevotellaceae bacterium]